ncbi:hypothetical protein [Mesonia mobilis]|uniref:hypothetical protein n=1 Tax=Mesonia mobilis TaxID=369791 RepID=UPI0024BBE3A5|nr:hypothetical protein [Mesonia mobilis]
MKIEDWFTSMDYNLGVELYQNAPNAKNRTLTQLKRGKSNRNMSLLISELRKLKKANLPLTKTTTSTKTKPKKVKLPQTDTAIHLELTRKQQKEDSAKSYFQKIKYGELPPELKIRFRLLKDVFYDMCDLHYALLEVPEDSKYDDDALEIMLQIEALDDRRTTIWKELDHWQTHKTLLPTKTENDFSALDPHKLLLKKASLKSSIHKMNKRLEAWRDNVEKETDKLKARKINQQIIRTEKKLHQNKIDLQKIEDLL